MEGGERGSKADWNESIMKFEVKNHMLPFFWQHGEDEATLRHYMQVIQEANCHAVCVESRPHPDFCGDGWWHDMDIILDEARKRDMKVWILDDSHFPTGYCNGAVKQAPKELRRGSICHRQFFHSGGRLLKKNLRLLQKKKISTKMLLGDLGNGNYARENRFSDDRILSVLAKNRDTGETVDLMRFVRDDVLRWPAPAGNWEIHMVFFTRNIGVRRSYMNMMDPESCRILIDTVYEPHFAHYGQDFGKTIAGFFSDEPELGNGLIYEYDNILGTEQDLPWSRPLARKLKEKLGADYCNMLHLLWTDGTSDTQRAFVRSTFMECVSRLVQECFSQQIGNWCREHGVSYIGHVIEDNNQHARTGSSLGHYFRGLSGQDMAGIDVVGGQIQPMGEDSARDVPLFGFKTDGEFCHFALGKLAPSAAAIEPKKHGNAMCEIFGAYGWSEGIRLEKYLLDHFMVRGNNHFVPHAFSPKKYPDKDCPPHFYAGGHNPQYRHFGKLMSYGNRVCSLICDGKPDTQVAILYHAEAEWAGKCMLMQKPGRVLAEHQIDYHFIPADVFAEPEAFQTRFNDGLRINGNCYRVLIVPYAQYIPAAFAKAIPECMAKGCQIVFVDALPDAVATGEPLPGEITACKVSSLTQLMQEVMPYLRSPAQIAPASTYIRLLHYYGQMEIYYLVNEQDQPYDGVLRLPAENGTQWFFYDAWENCDWAANVLVNDSGKCTIPIHLKALDTCILVKGISSDKKQKKDLSDYPYMTLESCTQSVCKSIDYPRFTCHKKVNQIVPYDQENPKFSGFIRYDFSVRNPGWASAVLEIQNAGEAVEVFANGTSLGIQVTPPFRYELDHNLLPDENQIRIEVATTLEREQGNTKTAAPTGITGDIRIYYHAYEADGEVQV